MRRLAAILLLVAAACTPGTFRRDVTAVVSGPTTVDSGATIQLTVRLEYSDGFVRLLSPTAMASVEWKSSNTAIATVNFQGIVTGVAAGTATITATPALTAGSGERIPGSVAIDVR